MNVDARCEQHVAAEFFGFVAHGCAHLLCQACVPRGCQTAADGECGGVIAVGIAVAFPVYAQSGGAVGQDNAGDAVLRKTGHGAGCAAHKVLAYAYKQLCFFFERHCVEHLVNVAFV